MEIVDYVATGWRKDWLFQLNSETKVLEMLQLLGSVCVEILCAIGDRNGVFQIDILMLLLKLVHEVADHFSLVQGSFGVCNP